MPILLQYNYLEKSIKNSFWKAILKSHSFLFGSGMIALLKRREIL